MDPVLRKWNCKNCGQRNKTVVAADGTVKCEYCTDVMRIPPVKARQDQTSGRLPEASARELVDDRYKRQVVARLREQYGEARELASMAEPYANLEWILGARRNRDRDEAAFDTGISELVVLWLQDLAVELDSEVAPPHAARTDEMAISAVQSRQAVAQSLRVATREFAVAFLRPS